MHQLKPRHRAIACRATWRVREDDIEQATLQIASKRLLLNDVIQAIEGVVFFFSCISGVCCNDETIFAALHNEDVEPEITQINVRNRGKQDLETAAKQLFQTVKDHNNPTMQEMVDVSNSYCYHNAPASSSDTEDEDEDEEEDEEEDDEFHPTHFPTVPCCFVIVNHGSYLQEFQNGIQKVQSDSLAVESTLLAEFGTRPSRTPSNQVISTIRKVEHVMNLSGHALYHSQIYARPNNAKFTYVSLMDVSSYLNKLLANDAINEQLVNNLKSVETILSHRAARSFHRSFLTSI